MAVGDFDGPHKLVTVFGSAYGTETWSFGVRMVPLLGVDNPEVTQVQADALKSSVSTWWATAGCFWPSSHTLQGVKLAPIGVNGKYPPGKIAYIGDIVDTVGGTSSNLHPAQCATVMTLLSASIGRGRGSKGRCYTPMPAIAISSVGKMGSWPNAAAPAFATMLSAWNAVTDVGRAVIMSRETASLPAGSSFVGSVRVDDVPDTQRRRRRQLVPTYFTSSVTP